MMRRLKTPVLAAFLTVLLTGCITWDTEELVIVLAGDGSGTMEATFGPVGSDEKGAAERGRDFAVFVYDIIENPGTGAPELTGVTGEMVDGPTGVFGTKRGSFIDFASFAAKFDLNAEGGWVSYTVKADEELITTNGTAREGEGGTKVITWPADADRIEYKIKRGGDFLQPAYKGTFSFKPEYDAFLMDREPVENIYVKAKLGYGFEALKEGDFKAAHSNFSDALRVDPSNETAAGELEKLKFLPYTELAERIPLPYIDVSIGMEYKSSALDEKNFIVVGERVEALKRELEDEASSPEPGPGETGPRETEEEEAAPEENGAAGTAEEAHTYCRLAELLGGGAGESGESDEYMEKALALYEETADLSGLTAESRMCYVSVLRRDGNYKEALEQLKSVIEEHPTVWSAYSQIVGDYSPEGSSPDPAEMALWLGKGDEELRGFLESTSELSHETSFEIFKYLMARTIYLAVARGTKVPPERFIDELTYRMISHAASKEPRNAKYRGALGYVQLMLLSMNMFASLDLATDPATDPAAGPAAVLAALQKLNRDLPDLLGAAKENFEAMERVVGPGNPLHLQNMAFLAFLKMDFDAAEELYIRSIDADPTRDDPLMMLTAFYSVMHTDGRKVRENKAKILLDILYRKIEASPRALDHFLAGKLELQRANYDKATAEFMAAVELDVSHYPSVVGMFKSWLLSSPLEADFIVGEIEKFLSKDLGWSSTDELEFTRGVALAVSGKVEEGKVVLKELAENRKEREVEGLDDALKGL